MKKIDHAYQNFDADKFLNSLKEFESESLLNFVTDHIIPSIKNYNEANDENGFFEQYVKDLVSTGEFFEKLKKSFEIVFKFENRLKEGVWNTAYVLLFKKPLIYLNYTPKIHNNEHRLIKSEDIDVEFKKIFGNSLDIEKLEELTELIKRLTSAEKDDKIVELFKKKYLSNVGNSSKFASEYIMSNILKK